MLQFDLPQDYGTRKKTQPTIGDFATKYWFRIIGIYFLFHLVFKVSPSVEPMSSGPILAEEQPQEVETVKAGVPNVFTSLFERSDVEDSSIELWASEILHAENPITAAQKSNSMREAKAFVERFAVVALKEQNKFGIPASIILAHGILNSERGTAMHLAKTNNYFGTNCADKSCPQQYESAWLSLRAHSNWVDKRLPAKRPAVDDLNGWLKISKSLYGKAEAEKLRDIIDVLDLHLLHRNA